MAHYDLDARHLLCPMPVIKTQNLSKNLIEGDTLTIVATDRGARQDLPCWCRINGHELLSSEEKEGEIFVTIRIVNAKK